MNFIQKLISSDKNVIVLMLGTIVAQAIPILATLLLTQLYSPEDFGLFQVYFSLTMVLSVLITLRYEMAIMLPKSDSDAKHVLVLSLLITTFFSLTIGLFLFFFGDLCVDILKTPELKQALWILPFTLFSIGTYQSFNYWANRKSLYKRLAISRVNRSIGTSVFSIGFGLMKSLKKTGLILGDTIGQFLASLVLFLWIFKSNPSLFKDIQKSKLKEVARRYKQFPFFNVPSGILEKLASHLPSLLLVPYYGVAVVGWFGLSQRMISLPGSIIARAYGDVFRQSATEAFNEKNNCKVLFVKTLKKLSLLSIPFFSISFFLVKPLFGFFFGSQWIIAGEYAQILIPMYCLQFIISPLSTMFLVAEKQKQEFILQIFLFISVAIGLYLSYLWFNTAKASIAAYCIIYSIKYIVELGLSYRFSKGK